MFVLSVLNLCSANIIGKIWNVKHEFLLRILFIFFTCYTFYKDIKFFWLLVTLISMCYFTSGKYLLDNVFSWKQSVITGIIWRWKILCLIWNLLFLLRICFLFEKQKSCLEIDKKKNMNIGMWTFSFSKCKVRAGFFLSKN